MIEFVLDILLHIPGSFIRWLLFHRDKKFKDVISQGKMIDSVISFAVLCFITWILYIAFS